MVRLALLALLALALVPATAAAGGDDGPWGQNGDDGQQGDQGGNRVVGAAYTESNDPIANTVIAFNRLADGRLEQRQVVLTGGQGKRAPQPGCEPPGGCPMLDSSGAVGVTENGRLVFAVNAGSNTVSSFRETPQGLQLVEQESTRGQSSLGDFPISLTVHGNLLYVLNSNSNTIVGFRFTPAGDMTPIVGSERPVSKPAPLPFSPRQIGFDQTGRVLVVSLLAHKTIDTFLVDAQGRAGVAHPNDSTTPLPFGFAFDPRNRLVMSQVSNLPGTGHTATYRLNTSSGTLTSIDTKSSGGQAPCWVVVTRDGQYTFVVNTGGSPVDDATIARYLIRENGFLNFLGLTPENGNEFARTDEALSRNSRYLYVLVPALFSPTSQIDEYRVTEDGNLILIGNTPSNLPEGVSGLAAR